MSSKRLIIVADGHELKRICQVLMSTGLSADRIHVSRDCQQEVASLPDVVTDLPTGRLAYYAEHEKRSCCRRGSCACGCWYCATPSDARVP